MGELSLVGFLGAIVFGAGAALGWWAVMTLLGAVRGGTTKP